MIEYNAKSWFLIIFKLKGSVLPEIYPQVLLSAFSGVLAGFFQAMKEDVTVPLVSIPYNAHTIILAAISFLLVFRNTLSYNRYWEGNKEIAGLVKGARELMSQITAFVVGPEGKQKREEYRRLINLQFIIIRMHLQAATAKAEFMSVQEVASKRDIGTILCMTADEHSELIHSRNRPLKVITWLRMKLVDDVNNGHLSIQYLKQMAPNITAFIQAWMNAERIIKTPFVFPYAQMVNLFIFLFCMTLPFTMAHTFGWWIILVAAIVAFALFGINTIGVEIENPFGDDANDLPLKEIEAEIRRDTLDILRCRDEDAEDIPYLIDQEDLDLLQERPKITTVQGDGETFNNSAAFQQTDMAGRTISSTQNSV